MPGLSISHASLLLIGVKHRHMHCIVAQPAGFQPATPWLHSASGPSPHFAHTHTLTLTPTFSGLILPFISFCLQIYIDSTFYGLQPDGDQHVAQQLRDSLEPLLYRYQASGTASGTAAPCLDGAPYVCWCWGV